MSIFRSISGFFSSKVGEGQSDRASSVSESESLGSALDACSGVYGGSGSGPGADGPVAISTCSRRTSSASIKSLSLIGPDVEPPDVDLSHLNEQEQAQIAAVIARARIQMQLDEEAAERTQTPSSSLSHEEFSVEKVERLCALCGSFIDAEDSVKSLCTTCQRPACVECGIFQDNSLKQVSEWLCLECQPPVLSVEESAPACHDENLTVISAEEGLLQERIESIEHLQESEFSENVGREENQVSQTAENFFQTYLVSLGEPLPDGSGENGMNNRPQVLNLGDQPSTSQLSPDDEVWLKFMGDILHPSTETVEEKEIPETESTTSEAGTDFVSSVLNPVTVPPMKVADSLPRVRPSPLDRVSHSGGSDQNQSPSRRSPKSPPSSPSWARYRESPTRSPVSRTRSPQMSPCDKHSSKLLEGMFVSMLSVQDNSCSDGSRMQDSSNAISMHKERSESTNVFHQAQSSDFQDPDHLAREEDCCVDLASYAATVASSTAYLMSMNTSPPELRVEEMGGACPTPVSSTYNAELHTPLQSHHWPTEEEIHRSSTDDQVLLTVQADCWSPLGDLYPILDVSPSIEKLEQEKMFSVGKQLEEGELRVDSEEGAEEEDISSEDRSAPSSKASGIMAPLKRCPSFSNIPSLTCGEEKPKIGKLPTELDDLTVYEEKDLLDNQIFDVDNFHGISNKTPIHSNALSMESVPNVTISDKTFGNYESEQVRCSNLLEIEDSSDLYSAASSPEVPSDSYNSIKLNVHALSAEQLDEQNFILSSDDDQEIDLDEDIPPKHLIGVGRSKALLNYGSSIKDSDQVNRNLVLAGNNDHLTDLIICYDSEVSRGLRKSSESPDCVAEEMKIEYEKAQDKTRTVGELMNILHQSDKQEERESKKKHPPPRPPPFKLPSAAAAATAAVANCVKGDSKKAIISFASYISDHGTKSSNAETSCTKDAPSVEEGIGMVSFDVDPCVTLKSKETLSSSGWRESSIEQSAQLISAIGAVEANTNEYPAAESSSVELQCSQTNFETGAVESHDQRFEDEVILPLLTTSSNSSSAACCPGPVHTSTADSSPSWPSLASPSSFSDPISLPSGSLSAAPQSDLPSTTFIPFSSSSVSLPGPSSGAFFQGSSSGATSLVFSSGASPHPASTALHNIQGSLVSAADLPVSVGILGITSSSTSSCAALTSHHSAVSLISDSNLRPSGEVSERRGVTQAKPKVPPKPFRPKRNDEEHERMSEIYGLKVPVNTHSLHQRVKEEMKIVTAARRLRLDEAGEVRIMEAELEERKRERRMKVQSSRDVVVLWGSPDKGTRQDIPKEDEVGLQEFRTSAERNEDFLSITETSQDVRRISASSVALSQQLCKQSRHHVRHPSDASAHRKELTEASKSSRRYSQTEEFQPRQVWTGNGMIRDDPPRHASPMMRNSYLSRSSNILDDYSYGSDVVLPNSQSESALPLTCGADDRPLAFRDLQDRYLKEEKLLKLQMEIEKRRQHLFKLEQAQVDSEDTTENQYTSNLPSRQLETSYGVIKPIDYQIDPEKYILRDKVVSWTGQESAKSRGLNPYLEPVYSSYEYLAHKTGQHMLYEDDRSEEFLLEDAFLNLPALSQYDLVDLVSYPDGDRLAFNSAQFTDNGTAGESDLYQLSSSCQPLSPFMTYDDIQLPHASCHHDFTSQRDATPAMSLLDDVTSRTRNILRDIGSRPLSDDMEKYFQVDEPLNLMFRDESEYSISESADDNVMEGGVTIRMLTNYKNPLSSSLHPSSQTYKFETKRILLTPDPKDKSVKENGIGLKIIGGKLLPWSDDELGAYVAAIYPGSVADQLHGELNEGDQVLEWNGERLTGRTCDEVQQIISLPACEVELVIRPGANLWTKKSSTMSTLRTATDSNHSSYENVQLLSSYNASMDALSAVTVTDPQQSNDPDVLVSHLGLSACMGPSTDNVSQDFQRGLQSQKVEFSAGSGHAPLSSGYESLPSPSDKTQQQQQQQQLPDGFCDDSVQQVSGQTRAYVGEIQLRLNYDDYNGALNVHLIQARDLLPRCKSGYADPLVKVALMPCRSSHDCKKSKQVLRTLNPEWHETLVFQNIAHQDLSRGKLEITVWDRDRYMPDQFMGEVVIDFAESQCLNNRLRWYQLKEYSQSRFDQNVQLAVLSSSDSGSSAASHANPSNNFDLAPGKPSDSQNSIQSPSQPIDVHPLQIRSVEGGPVQDDPLLIELEEASCKYVAAKDNVDLSTHNDSDPEMERFKGHSQSEAYGLLQSPFLAQDEHGSNSRSNVSTPIDAIFEEVRCHMEERRSPDGHDNKFSNSSVLASSLHGFLSSLSCCVRPVTNNGRQQHARSNSQVFSR